MVDFLFANISNDLHILIQAVAALVLGGAIGWEREVTGKWAGLRTHMLVCLASMLFIQIGQTLVRATQGEFTHDILRIDPVRMIEAIMTGVAFLGAGTVFRDTERNTMRGLTTAASLLTAAPVGIAIALDRYILAVGITLLVLFVLGVMRRIEDRIRPEPPPDPPH